jgi:transcriptional antiterminator Rof (Rho-off)
MSIEENILNVVTTHRDDIDFLENLTIECAKANKVIGMRFILEKAPHVANIHNVITNTTSKEIVDIALSVLNNNVPRSLNTCLREVKDLSILKHLLTHRRAKFLVGYRQYECVRLAVLDGDVQRVNTFLQNSNVDIHSSGVNTMDKTCVELACMFKYDIMIEMFMGHGLNCLCSTYSDNIKKHVIELQCEFQKKREIAVNELLQAYISNRMSVPYAFINSSNVMSRIISPYKKRNVYQREYNSLINRLQYM